MRKPERENPSASLLGQRPESMAAQEGNAVMGGTVAQEHPRAVTFQALS